MGLMNEFGSTQKRTGAPRRALEIEHIPRYKADRARKARLHTEDQSGFDPLRGVSPIITVVCSGDTTYISS